MKNRRCCISCAVVILALLVITPAVSMAQGVVLSTKDAAMATYMDRLEAGVLRMREEDRMLKALSQEQALNEVSQRQPPLEEQLEPPEQQKPENSVFTVSRGILKDMFANAEFRSSLAATMKFDDNTGLDKEDIKSDWIYNLNPSWNLKLTRGQSYFGLNYSYNFGYYLKHSSQDTESQSLAATLFYRPSNIFSFELDESLEDTNAVDLFNLGPITIDRFNRAHHRVTANSLSGVFTYMPWGRTNLAHLTFSDKRAYSVDRSLQSYTDAVGFNIEHYLNPILSFYLGTDFNQTLYEAGSSNDQDGRSILMGLKYDLSSVTKAQARLSYDTSKDDAGVTDEGYSLTWSLNHKLTNFTALTGTYVYGLANSVTGDYRRYHQHNLNLSLGHQLSERVSLSLGTAFSLDRYFEGDFIGAGTAVGKQRRQYSFNCGLSQKLYNWLNLDFTYRHAGSLSDFAGEDYVSNVYTWGATLNF